MGRRVAAPVQHRLLGFSGVMHSGKTSAADAMQGAAEAAGHRVTRLSFATPLRRVLEILTGVSVENTRSAADKARALPGAWGMTVGQALQRLGTDAIRNHFHADTWVFAALGEYDRAVAQDSAATETSETGNAGATGTTLHLWIFDDVRFPNEADAIIARGGAVVRIARPSARTVNETRDSTHVSETAMERYAQYSACLYNIATDIDNWHQYVLERLHAAYLCA